MQKKIDNLNRPVRSTKFELVIKKKTNNLTKKSSGPHGFNGEYYQIFKEGLQQFFTNSSKK